MDKTSKLLAEDHAHEKASHEERVRLLQEVYEDRVDSLEFRQRITVQVILVCWLCSVVGLAFIGGLIKWA